MRGFGLLAKMLADYEGSEAEFLRPTVQFPPWTKVQTLQLFPFVHTIPFLGLVDSSREPIRRCLMGISGSLVSSEISDARNEWLHGRKTAADLDRLRLGLEKVGEAIHDIEESGFSRQRYSWVRNDTDGEGRRTAVLANLSGRQLALFRPSPFAWLGLPSLSGTWYVMHSARFAEPSEVLRFGVELESPYSRMWSNYPQRPKAHRFADAMAEISSE
jgi:hypothetical protein